MPKPPPGVLLAYRFFGWRVGPAHADWVLSDITRPGWIVRQGSAALAGLFLAGTGVIAVVGGGGRIPELVFVLAMVGLFMRTSLKERALRQQGIDPDGVQLTGARWYTDEAARLRRNVLGTVSTVVLVVAGLTILALRSG